MTSAENTALERLRDDLHNYHVDVQRLIQRCETCRGEVESMRADIYGLPGDKRRSPGLLGDVAELRQSRRAMLRGLRGAWVLLTALAGAVVGAFLKNSR
jgi:hypothetical protein